MSIASNITKIKNQLSAHVQLVVVSKTQPLDKILEAYTCGQRIFGENKVQELTQKHAELPKDIQWHLIGHLQTNKVKFIAPYVTLIHSVDSLKLLIEINKEAIKNERIIDCLLQVKVSTDDTKFGMYSNEIKTLLVSEDFRKLRNVRIVGVMGMASLTEEQNQIRSEFRNLKQVFDQLRHQHFLDAPYFQEISMGMSDDYQIAIEEGSTMIRLGSILFGSR